MYCHKPDIRNKPDIRKPVVSEPRTTWRSLIAGFTACSLVVTSAACGSGDATYAGRCAPLQASVGQRDVDIVGAWMGQGDEKDRVFVFQPDGTWLLWLEKGPGMELREFGRFTALDDVITLSSPDGRRSRAEAFSVDDEELRILIADGHPEPPTYHRASCEPWWSGPVD